MTSEEIQAFNKNKNTKNEVVQISFRSRPSLKGLFLNSKDSLELQRKNLWRIVSESHLPSYMQSGDESFSRIFNGVDITRMEVIKTS